MTIPQTLLDAGCGTPQIPLLQPADPFLDTAGEDLRRRIFLTQEAGGKLHCLRPEFTIPVCLHHLQLGAPSGRYAYAGSVFRQREQGDHEFIQAGFESLGSMDRASTDLDAIELAIQTVRQLGARDLTLTLGNQALFEKLLDVLSIPSAWRKRLLRFFGSTPLLRGAMDAMGNGSGPSNEMGNEELVALLEKQDAASVEQWVSNRMVDDGLPMTGGRTASAIAGRLIEKHELASVTLSANQRAVLEDFLSLEMPLARTGNGIAEFEKRHGLDLGDAGQEVANLSDALNRGAAMAGLQKAIFEAGFGRRLDYYTGLVFELHKQGQKEPVAGGGRYDRLLQLLGAPHEMPAVGFAIWMDRLGAER